MEDLFEEAVKAAEDFEHMELLEVSKTVMMSMDEQGDHCIVVMPQLGIDALSPKRFKLSEEDIIKAIFNEFCRMTRGIVTDTGSGMYSIVYVHPSTINILGYRGKILKMRKILPDAYKKRLRVVRVVHSTIGFTSLMTSLRLAISGKFFKKMSYFSDIRSLQVEIGADTVELPVDVHATDDALMKIGYGGRMPSLESTFSESLKQPELMWRCEAYIRAYGFTETGLFRIPGHHKLRQMALARAQNKDVGNARILFGPPTGESLHEIDPMTVPGHMTRASMSSMDLGPSRGENSAMSTLIIRDPLVAAGLYKQCLRDLPEPVITFQAYSLLMQVPLLDGTTSDETLLEAINLILDRMPRCNVVTLASCLTLMAQAGLCEEHTNVKMSELCSFLAPTLMRSSTMSGKSITVGDDGRDGAVAGALLDINKSKKIIALKLAEEVKRISTMRTDVVSTQSTVSVLTDAESVFTLAESSLANVAGSDGGEDGEEN